MEKKAITSRQAKKLADKLNLCFDGEADGRTYYATNSAESALWEFDSKKERDEFVKK